MELDKIELNWWRRGFSSLGSTILQFQIGTTSEQIKYSHISDLIVASDTFYIDWYNRWRQNKLYPFATEHCRWCFVLWHSNRFNLVSSNLSYNSNIIGLTLISTSHQHLRHQTNHLRSWTKDLISVLYWRKETVKKQQSAHALLVAKQPPCIFAL